MSAYASVTNIQEEFKSVSFGASTVITSTRVSRIIDEVEAEINAKVGQVYQVPLTGAQSVLIVRRISIEMVATIIRGMLEVKSNEADTSQVAKKDPLKAARDRIQAIVDRTLPLPDATLLSTTKGATDYDVGDTNVAFTFDRLKTQW